MAKKKTGKFIVIDGSDGTGKATQLALLQSYLTAKKIKCEVTAFPQYGKKSAGLVEEYLAGTYGKTDPYTASVFYAVDRFDASFQIRKWLAEGKVVLSDRYVTANAGHQGGKIVSKGARKKYFDWLNDFEYRLMNLPKPDLNVILSIPYSVSMELLKNRTAKGGGKLSQGKDLHESDPQHLKRAAETFVEIGKIFPNTRLIECTDGSSLMSREQIHTLVRSAVDKIISQNDNARKSR